MKKQKKRIAFIGAGGRANAYTMYGVKEQFEFVGVADPNAGNRKTFLGLNSLVGMAPEFDSYEEMLDAVEDIQGVVISTPNHEHIGPAVACMKRGIPIALEKPIAESMKSCHELLATKRAFNGRALVGFVMRSTPFYLQAKRWVDAGRIGQIITIQADEIPPLLTTSVMFRSDWRRFRSMSGGSLNEKCCHDIDMLRWISGSEPTALTSFAGRKSFAPRPDLPDRCDECPITAECDYYLPPSVYDHPDQINKANDGLLYKFTRDNSSCIYNNGHDIYDHQQVLIYYANGASASLTVDFSGKGSACGRNLKIVGTEGVISGKLEDNKIAIQSKHSDATEIVELKDDGSGHGGSNRTHADRFLQMIEDPNMEPEATIEDGFLSSMMCFHADESVEKKTVIDVRSTVAEATGAHSQTAVAV